MTLLEVAQAYVERGWRVVPIPFRSKNPALTGWTNLRLTAEKLPAIFNGAPGNIGVLLGAPSGDLIDVDLDCPEALLLAPSILPKTPAVFGRLSKPRSHYLYVSALETEKFDVPPRRTGTATQTGTGRTMLVELRSTGGQTLFPGSTHPEGEPVAWESSGAPVPVAPELLRQAVAELATACLLARAWPAEGQRHDAALAAAGFLARGGVPDDRVALIVNGAARVAKDENRRGDVLSTLVKLHAGEAVTGGPALAEVLTHGKAVVRAIRKWLRFAPAVEAPAPGRPTCTDSGNGQRFAAQHGEAVRYCYAWSAWLQWQDGRWQRDAGDAVMRRAKATARAVYAEAAAETDANRRQALSAWAVKSEGAERLRAMLFLAQSEPGIPVRPDELDRDPYLLNCPNGTLELRSGHLRPHRREDLLTKMTAAPYNPEARHPVFDRFLAEALPDDGARAYAQRFAGYCLTGATREEVFVFALGPAGGGKSTFIEALRRTWGDYAVSADFSTFLAARPSDGPREDVARLAGARLVTSVETRDTGALAAGIVKLLTGGDTVVGRRLYEQSFEFVPQFKLLLGANDRPRAAATDEGLWRRLRELPFPTARPSAADRDDTIKATLTDPAQAGPAILAWAADGCAAWFTDGLGEPPVVTQATEAYRRSQDDVTTFVGECCRLGHGLEITASALRKEYEK